jgi:Uma2 family endonuclease
MTRATRQPPSAGELTFEEYLRQPMTKRRQEVIDGVTIVSPTPTVWHQRLSMRLARSCEDHVSQHNLGLIVPAPIDVLIRKAPKLRTRQPDLLFLGAAKLAGLDLKRTNILEVAPDLVVEIASPSDRPGAWAEKLADYAAIGVREVWRVDPEAETVEVLAPDGGAYRQSGLFRRGEVIASAVLPGIALPVAAVFE